MFVLLFQPLRRFRYESSNFNFLSGTSGTFVIALRKVAKIWRFQWRTIWVTDLADRSATLKAFVQEWVRVDPDGGTAREDFSRSPSQRLSLRTSVESKTRGENPPDVGRDHASCAAEGPSSRDFDHIGRHDHTRGSPKA